jgi:MoxR-like ATPase
MAREHRIFVSDRKVVKLYKLLRAKAWLERSGEVLRSDLGLMAYLGNTLEQLAVLRHRIPQYLGS